VKTAPCPAASSPGALRRMQSARQRDTKPEMAIRRIIHSAGYRFRVNRRVVANVNRRADIVFPSAKVAVFVDGCFWHCCPKHATFPKSNSAWWAAKLEMNRLRDAETTRILRAAGWCVIRVWEHEMPARAAARIVKVVCARRRLPH
jgi:DNA mismatch endonuclease, patch repair protein